jgi:phosphoserine phosphatase
VIPVFVDMDGTLIKGSTSSTEIKSYVKKNGIFQLTRNVIKNRLFDRLKLKTWVSNQEHDSLKYDFNQEILQLLRELQNKGLRLILATASPALSTERVMSYSPLEFQDVISSNSFTNLKGSKKLIAIKLYMNKNHVSEFFYIGDSYVDLEIMKHSKSSLFVGRKIHFLIGKYISRIDNLHNLKTFEQRIWA